MAEKLALMEMIVSTFGVVLIDTMVSLVLMNLFLVILISKIINRRSYA